MEYQNNFQAAVTVRDDGPKILSSYKPCIFCGHRYPIFKGIKVVGGYSLNTEQEDISSDSRRIFICDRCIIAKALLSLSHLITDEYVGKGLIEAAAKIMNHQKATRDNMD